MQGALPFEFFTTDALSDEIQRGGFVEGDYD